MTNAETMLWRALHDRRLSKHKFRRQVPIGSYIADFACVNARLIVELDGPPHQPIERQDRDQTRDLWLREQGWLVLRLSNDAVLGGGNIALDAISQELKASPAPSSDLR